jgi:ribose transport system permease protein
MLARLRVFFRFQESGLLLVILALGLLLTVFAGKVRKPVFERSADGTRSRVFTTDATGLGNSIDIRPAYFSLAFIMKQ